VISFQFADAAGAKLQKATWNGMRRMKGKKAIELVLDGQALEQFLNIKRARGLKDDMEVLKLIIDWYIEKKLT
jgi:hypothetical protein